MLIVTICGKRLALVSQKGRVLRVHVNPDKDGPDGWTTVNPDTDGPDPWNGGLFQVWSPALLPRGGGQAFVEFAEYHLDNGEKLTLIADAKFTTLLSNGPSNEEGTCDSDASNVATLDEQRES